MFFLPFCEEKKLVINIHLRRLSPLMLLWWIVAAEKKKSCNFFGAFLMFYLLDGVIVLWAIGAGWLC